MEQKRILLKEIYDFLKDRNLINELCARADASPKTVAGTFESSDFSALKGKQINICSVAIQMIEEIKQLSTRAADALNK